MYTNSINAHSVTHHNVSLSQSLTLASFFRRPLQLWTQHRTLMSLWTVISRCRCMSAPCVTQHSASCASYVKVCDQCRSRPSLGFIFRGCLGDETARPEGPRRGWVLGEGAAAPSPPARVSGERCKLPQWVWGFAPENDFGAFPSLYKTSPGFSLEAIFVTRTVLATVFL